MSSNFLASSHVHSAQMRPVATDVTHSVVCLSVCLCVGHTGELCKHGWQLTRVGPRNHVLDGVSNPHKGRGKFEGANVPAHSNAPMPECIVLLSVHTRGGRLLLWEMSKQRGGFLQIYVGPSLWLDTGWHAFVSKRFWLSVFVVVKRWIECLSSCQSAGWLWSWLDLVQLNALSGVYICHRRASCSWHTVLLH